MNIRSLFQNTQVFAGLHRSRNGVETPTGIGRLCNWTPNPDGPSADEFTSFGAYQRTLSLKCDEGNPGVITWTPDADTPDTVFYHCFTHRYLGWRINVLDSCENAQASEVEAVYAEADEGIDAEPSIRHETKVRAGNNYLDQNAENLKNHNMNEAPPKLQFQLGGTKELNKLLNAGIMAAEILEEQSNRNETALHEDSMNEGERLPGRRPSPPSTVADIKIPTVHSVQLNPDTGLPLFLKHPKNGQYLRPAQVPLRRYPTILIEKRPMNHQKRPIRPFVMPQPAPLMNHYKPHAAPQVNRHAPGNGPQKPLKPVLVLGQPTDIKPHNSPPHYMGSHGRVPFPDHIPQGYIRRPDRPYNSMLTAASNTQPKKVPVEHHGKDRNEPAPKFSAPINSREVIPKATIKPAENVGFLPQTVIVESGFRPITNRKPGDRRHPERKSEQRRRADIITEIDEAIEGDALLINSHHEEPIRSFEPMFIPSPRDEMAGVVAVPMKVETVQQQQKQLQMQQMKQHLQEHQHHEEHMNDEEEEEEEDEDMDEPEIGQDENMEDDDESPNYPKISNREKSMNDEELPSLMNFDSGEDNIAAAASRVDAYYLPPDNKAIKSTENTDREIPVGAVVTYDGKAVLDTSLINSAPPDDVNELVLPGLTTKTEQLRKTPQFGPFKGEMPPLSVSAFVPPDSLTQLKPELNRYRSTGPVTEYSNPLTTGNTLVGAAPGSISTKLTLLKSERKRREVHRQEYAMNGHGKIVPAVSILLVGVMVATAVFGKA